MLRALMGVLTGSTRREEARLARLREMHWRWDEQPFGRKVQLRRRINMTNRRMGTVGQVLTEAEHEIIRRNGWTEMEPKFPGVHGVHVLVRFPDSGEPEPVNLDILAPA